MTIYNIIFPHLFGGGESRARPSVQISRNLESGNLDSVDFVSPRNSGIWKLRAWKSGIWNLWKLGSCKSEKSGIWNLGAC